MPTVGGDDHDGAFARAQKTVANANVAPSYVADAIRAAVRISEKIQKRCEKRRGKTAREPIAQRALTAEATSLRNCYWLPGLSEFDSAKMRRLSNEIGSRAKRAEDKNALIACTKMAVDDFLSAKRIKDDAAKARKFSEETGVAIANKKTSVRNTIETLQAFSRSVRVVAELWRTVGPMIHGRLRASDSPQSGERPTLAERIGRVLGEDIWSLLAAIDETTKQLETAKSIRLLDEYRCVMRIAMAWK